MRCPDCDRFVQKTWRFCPHCGINIEDQDLHIPKVVV